MSTVRRVLEGLDEITGWQEQLYVHLHANPELSMQETETAADVTKRLDELGYETQQMGGVDGTSPERGSDPRSEQINPNGRSAEPEHRRPLRRSRERRDPDRSTRNRTTGPGSPSRAG